MNDITLMAENEEELKKKPLNEASWSKKKVEH